MRLDQLAPQFLRYEVADCRIFLPYRDTIEEAQGVAFYCPLCFARNGGERGTHTVICWSRSRGVPDDAKPGPGRWLLIGNGYGDLTLIGDGGSNSVDLSSSCGAHFFVTNGEVVNV